LQPNLGVAQVDELRTLVLADIPGLIEGAHAGVGLGHEFLRHIERTRILIHLLDGAAEDPLADFRTVNEELRLFAERLAEKPQLVAMNKMDLTMAQERWPQLKDALAAMGYEAMAISAVSGQGVRELLFRAAELVDASPAEPEPEPQAITLETLQADGEVEDDGFDIKREFDGGWRVSGTRIERVVRRINWDYEEAVDRFQGTLERMGIRAALEAAGVQEGDTVYIGDVELEWRN
jgi:GTP-binding protein